MREIQESQGKVEFALDNRQVFFLFFGLSVVGCFVFALGVLVGRQDGGAHEVPLASASGAPAIEGLAEVAAVASVDPAAVPADSFAFKDGLSEPATAGMPETRDPKVPPRDEKVLKAQREAIEGKGKKEKEPVLARVEPRVGTAKGEPPLAGASEEPVAVAPTAEFAGAEAKKPGEDTVMASAGQASEGAEAASSASKQKRAFTLQLKAFAAPEDAEKMADKLRRNGHDVRVEPGEVQGRTWHRVRMGSFNSWDKALEAKMAFERQEQVIAYVVPQ